MAGKAIFLVTALFLFSACDKEDVPKDVCDGAVPKLHTVTVPKGAAHRRSEGSIWYDPLVLTIKVCDQVVWENKDWVYHTATSDKEAKSFFNLYIGVGAKSVTQQFKETGENPYHCAPHPWMKGKIVVTP